MHRELRKTQLIALICARDAAGRVETGEKPSLDVDPHRAFAEVSTATGDYARQQRRPVVLLITQRRMVRLSLAAE